MNKNLKPIATEIIHLLNQTPIDIGKLQSILRSYPFPPKREEAFSYALGRVMTTHGEVDTETQLRLQILQLVYQQTIPPQ